MTTELNALCAGAVKGLALALQERFESATGTRLRATFGAVGALRDALRAGAACDVFVATEAMVAALAAGGELRPESRRPIGRVATAIAVPSGAPRPAIESGDALRASLDAASAVYFPDATLSTAGAHVAMVLERLGIAATLAPRLRMFANGAAAMAALAAAGDDRAIGCTQATEILATPGLDLVGGLPPPFDLATVYGAAVTARATDAALAGRFIALLAGAESLAARVACGFAKA